MTPDRGRLSICPPKSLRHFTSEPGATRLSSVIVHPLHSRIRVPNLRGSADVSPLTGHSGIRVRCFTTSAFRVSQAGRSLGCVSHLAAGVDGYHVLLDLLQLALIATSDGPLYLSLHSWIHAAFGCPLATDSGRKGVPVEWSSLPPVGFLKTPALPALGLSRFHSVIHSGHGVSFDGRLGNA